MELQNSQEWYKEVKITDIPPAYREVAELIGVENAIRLAGYEGGRQVYRPKVDEIMRAVRDRMIRADRANGLGYAALASKYHLTEVWIRQLVDHQEDDRQLAMF